MKKLILLATMVVSLVTVAKTTGNVEFFNNNDFKIPKDYDSDFIIDKFGINTDIKIQETGLSFGSTLQAKKIQFSLGDYPVLHSVFNNSSTYLKYEFGKSYVKATLNPKVGDGYNDGEKLLFEKGNIVLETDTNYEISKNIKIGLNSNTKFNFETRKGFLEKEKENISIDIDKKDLNYGSNVISTHKLYLKALESNNNKKEFKDINACISLQHSYSQNENDYNFTNGKSTDKKINNSLKYISLAFNAAYPVNNYLDVYGKFRFKYQFSDYMNYENQYLGDTDLLNCALDTFNLYFLPQGHENSTPSIDKDKNYKVSYKLPITYIHSYQIGASYKKLSNTQLNIVGYINHFNISDIPKFKFSILPANIEDIFENSAKIDALNYGLTYDIKYKGFKNITLFNKTTLSGLLLINNQKDNTKSYNHLGLFNITAGSKYDYIINNKFTLSPELKINSKFITLEKKLKYSEFTILPKISAAYRLTENLTINGLIEIPVEFKHVKHTNGFIFEYDNTSVKTGLNIKYTW